MIDPFETRTIGRTSVTVPRFGLGTAPLGGWPEALPAERARATVRHAWDRGIRFFDTAPLYGHGNSERHLGAALSGLPRDGFTLSTKVGRVLETGPPGPTIFQDVGQVSAVFDFSAAGVRRSLAESLDRLGVDRVDICLIHDPDDHHEQAVAEAYPVLADLRAQGRIGAVGVGMNVSGALARFATEGDFDCFLLAGRYTLLEQDALDDLLPVAVDTGISIIAGGVYNSGLLVDPRPGASYNYAPAPADVIERAVAIRRVCDEHGVPLRAAALQFPLAHPAVATAVVGARSPEEVDDNLAMAAVPVPASLWADLKERGLVRPDAPTPA
jgi:aryl-alcohol dehydrogenase-like predicted oxidoreductase